MRRTSYNLRSAVNEFDETLLIRAQDRRAFAASEMVECTSCARANPPTRATCLYCGAALEATERNIGVPLSPALTDSKSENALNLVALPADVDEETVIKITTVLDSTPSELKGILSSRIGAPVCRVGDSGRAEMMRDRLREFGIETLIISDQQLDLSHPQKDLGTLEFSDTVLTGVSRRGAERASVQWEDVTLIVAGRLLVTTVEVEQKRKQGRIVDERELSSDEAVLDIYSRAASGWRVRSGSFDFSCLQERKGITAFENFSVLTSVLREQAGSAEFDDSYNRSRPGLTRIWSIENPAGRTERHRDAARGFETTITSRDNEEEFNRYSRILSVLRTSESGRNS